MSSQKYLQWKNNKTITLPIFNKKMGRRENMGKSRRSDRKECV